MKRLIYLSLSVLPFCNTSCSNTAKKAPKPNIIFIFADDMEFRELSCYGQQHYKTPHLDQLARNGVRFTQAYTGAPSCAPSRGTLLTSLHTGHGPIRANGSARGQEPLSKEDITIAEVLKSAGYATCMAGKWGLGEYESYEGFPENQGFDVAFGFYSQVRAHTYFPDYLESNGEKIPIPQNAGFDMAREYSLKNEYDENGDLILNELKNPKEAVYSVDEIEKVAMKFIRDNRDNPFFLYFPTQLPHFPPIIPNLGEMQYLTDIPLYEREKAAMTIRLDHFVGKLVAELRSLGIYENTMIFFSVDNGMREIDPSAFEINGPFTGGKYSILEGGIRVPFFVSWEGKIRPNVISQPVWLLDFFPTAAKLAGATYTHKIDGVDLWPLLGGDPRDFKPAPYMYWNSLWEQSVRMGPWFGYRKSLDDPLLLYLPEEDACGERNLAAIFPEVTKSIETIMDTAYTPHPWFLMPNETLEDGQKKIERARKEGLIIPRTMPNGLDEFHPSSPFRKQR